MTAHGSVLVLRTGCLLSSWFWSSRWSRKLRLHRRRQQHMKALSPLAVADRDIRARTPATRRARVDSARSGDYMNASGPRPFSPPGTATPTAPHSTAESHEPPQSIRSHARSSPVRASSDEPSFTEFTRTSHNCFERPAKRRARSTARASEVGHSVTSPEHPRAPGARFFAASERSERDAPFHPCFGPGGSRRRAPRAEETLRRKRWLVKSFPPSHANDPV